MNLKRNEALLELAPALGFFDAWLGLAVVLLSPQIASWWTVG
jgi:hypothetical protein